VPWVDIHNEPCTNICNQLAGLPVFYFFYTNIWNQLVGLPFFSCSKSTHTPWWSFCSGALFVCSKQASLHTWHMHLTVFRAGIVIRSQKYQKLPMCSTVLIFCLEGWPSKQPSPVHFGTFNVPNGNSSSKANIYSRGWDTGRNTPIKYADYLLQAWPSQHCSDREKQHNNVQALSNSSYKEQWEMLQLYRCMWKENLKK